MTDALLNLLDEMTPLHRFDDTIPPLVRHLIGDGTSDLLLVPKSDLVDDLGRLESVAKWFFVHVFGRTERDSPRYRLVSHMVRPFGRDCYTGYSGSSGVGSGRRSTYPITSPAAGSCRPEIEHRSGQNKQNGVVGYS